MLQAFTCEQIFCMLCGKAGLFKGVSSVISYCVQPQARHLWIFKQDLCRAHFNISQESFSDCTTLSLCFRGLSSFLLSTLGLSLQILLRCSVWYQDFHSASLCVYGEQCPSLCMAEGCLVIQQQPNSIQLWFWNPEILLLKINK